jgi:Protein of unknown function (DUF2846)
MKKFIFVTVLSVSALFLTIHANAASHHTGDSTFIYVYRVGQFSGAAANWAVFLDGQKTCKLSNNKFMRLAVTPGKHTISAKVGGMTILKKETEIEVEATAGGSYYVACNVKQSITRQRLEMVEVVKSTANKQMEKMSLDNCQEE